MSMRGGARPGSGRKKGSIPWNKGIPMRLESKKKLSASKRGTPAWNKGLPAPWAVGNKHAKGRVGFWKGKTLPKEVVEKLRLAKKGKTSNFKGKKLNLEQREKIRQKTIAYFKKVNPNYVYLPNPTDQRKWIRRERIKQYGGFHSVGEWENLKKKSNYACLGCSRKEPEIKLTRDHIIAIANGGTDYIENIQPLCVSCNSRKSLKSIRY